MRRRSSGRLAIEISCTRRRLVIKAQHDIGRRLRTNHVDVFLPGRDFRSCRQLARKPLLEVVAAAAGLDMSVWFLPVSGRRRQLNVIETWVNRSERTQPPLHR